MVKKDHSKYAYHKLTLKTNKYKKMKHILKIIIVVFILVFTSCSNDDDNTRPTPLPEKKLKSIVSTTTSGNSSFTTSFNYDAAGKWTSGTTFNENYTISYNSDGKIAQYYVEGQPSSSVEFQYVTNSSLLEKILADTYETVTSYSNGKYLAFQFFDGSLVNELTVTYDSDNRIETITNNDESVRDKFIYDAQNRIIRVEKYSATNPTAPYVLSTYTDYEYEEHKSPVYTFFKTQLDFGQLIFSPVNIYPFYSRLFSFSDFGYNIYILPEYHIKSLKQYYANNTTSPVLEVLMNYTLENNQVVSFTTTSVYNGSTNSETTNYTYEN